MRYRIVRATADDARTVHAIMRAAFAEYVDTLRPPSGANRETVDDVRAAIEEGGAVLVWDVDRAIGSARFRHEPACLYVGRVSVLPDARRRGVASAIMAWMENEARAAGMKRVCIASRMSLESNLALYQRLGYALIDVQPHPKGPDRIATLIKDL